MVFIKKFFVDKSRIAILSVCLLMLSVAMISALTEETLAADTGESELPTKATSIIVTLISNGGSSTLTVTGSVYPDLPTPTREGVTFLGWYTSLTDTGIKVSFGSKLQKTESHYLYAKWFDVVTVTFNPNGGSVNPTSRIYAVDGTYDPLPTPTRNGYKFSGWYTSSSGGTQIEENTEVSNTSAHTLFAHWKAIVYAINLEQNGDDVDTFVKTHVVTYGKTYGDSESLPTPIRTGYTLSLTLNKAYDTKLDLAVNVGNITDSDNALADIYLITMAGTGFETGSSKIIDTIKNCKNGKNTSTITDLNPDTEYTFQVVLRTEKGFVLAKYVIGKYVTFKTEPKKSIIENITESPQTGMLATILVSLICISSLGGLMYYRKKINNNI